LARLIDGPLAVGELARDFPVSRPAISQHLRVLKEQTGGGPGRRNRRLYQLHPEGFATLREYFEQFWVRHCKHFAARWRKYPKQRRKSQRRSQRKVATKKTPKRRNNE